MSRVHRPGHLALLVAGYAGSIALYPAVPEHSNLIAFALPTAAATIYALHERLWRRDFVRPHDRTTEATFEAILLRILIFILALHVMVLAGLLALQRDGHGVIVVLARAVPVLLGLALASVGNLLPRLRRNLVIGIRTHRALEDAGVWQRTNRAAGYVTVALGLLFVAAGLLLPLGPWMGGAAGLATLVALAIVAGQAWRVERWQTSD